MKGKCELCDIECDLTLHHLIPQVKCKNKYREIKNNSENHIMICRPCHDYIHATYDNTYLRDFLDTLDKLKADEKIIKFIEWRKKHSDFNGHSKMSNSQKLKNK